MTKSSIFPKILLTAALTHSALGAPEVKLDHIIARVEDQIILQSEFAQECQLWEQHQGVLTLAHQRQIFENMLLGKMLLASALAEGITAEKAAVEEALRHRLAASIQEAGSAQRLESYAGLPLPTLQEIWREAIREQLLISKMQDAITDNITLSPREVRSFFAQMPEEDIPYYPAQVQISQLIYIPSDNLQEGIAHLEDMRQSFSTDTAAFEKVVLAHAGGKADTQLPGQLIGVPLGSMTSVDQLAPEVFFAVDSMAVGTLSEPIPCTTAYGTQAVQIVYLKASVPAHRANLAQDYENIYKMACEAQQMERLQTWFEHNKRSMLIEVVPAYQVYCTDQAASAANTMFS
ncbi:MAG: hypothetical protein AAFV97_01535 [Bacteroidota bacterium]